MTYHDTLTQKTSYELYRKVSAFMREGGELMEDDLALFLAVAESDYEDESYKDALVDLVERLHDEDLL